MLSMRIRKYTDTLKKDEIDIIAECSDALAHPARVEIFRFIYKANLERKTVCNKDIVENFEYAQSTVSQHVSKLTGCGLVEAVKQGSKAQYYVNLGLLGQYLSAVKKLNQ